MFDIAKHDIKKTWLVIKENLNKKNSNKIHKEFVINDQTVCDPDEIANKFNDYFLNIARNLADKN